MGDPPDLTLTVTPSMATGGSGDYGPASARRRSRSSPTVPRRPC